MRYPNRRAAGRRLAKKLRQFYSRNDVVVLGLPRGGVPVAFEIAKALRAPLDILVVRKLGVPWQPELAFGALASGNVIVENPSLLRLTDDAANLLKTVLADERIELARREHVYRSGAAVVPVKHRTAIVVDDGMATGATMVAAVRSLRQQEIASVIVAIPVASKDAIERLRSEANDVVCLQTPSAFYAVGEWYEDFLQTEDGEVQALLAEANNHLISFNIQA